MSCSSCKSNYVNISKYEIKEVASGSPSRGKNMIFDTFSVKHIRCLDCQTQEAFYQKKEIGKR